MNTKIAPAAQLHFLRAGVTIVTDSELSFPQSVTSHRGLSITLTQRIIDSNTDREGNSWLNLVDNPEGQRAKWGEVVFAAGPAPASMRPWLPGSVEEELAGQRARAAAYDLPLADQAAALREVSRTFPRKITSTTLNGATS